MKKILTILIPILIFSVTVVYASGPNQEQSATAIMKYDYRGGNVDYDTMRNFGFFAAHRYAPLLRHYGPKKNWSFNVTEWEALVKEKPVWEKWDTSMNYNPNVIVLIKWQIPPEGRMSWDNVKIVPERPDCRVRVAYLYAFVLDVNETVTTYDVINNIMHVTQYVGGNRFVRTKSGADTGSWSRSDALAASMFGMGISRGEQNLTGGAGISGSRSVNFAEYLDKPHCQGWVHFKPPEDFFDDTEGAKEEVIK